mmetsp:Transcript_12051/g.21199  ORF Transcript_12051/g.21199 Transcript_12051/m.21199 type:complete len:99 (+) Transcript_12051:481-777(+)
MLVMMLLNQVLDQAAFRRHNYSICINPEKPLLTRVLQVSAFVQLIVDHQNLVPGEVGSGSDASVHVIGLHCMAHKAETVRLSPTAIHLFTEAARLVVF